MTESRRAPSSKAAPCSTRPRRARTVLCPCVVVITSKLEGLAVKEMLDARCVPS